MLRAGTVTGYKIGKNRNGTHNVLLLQVRISGANDIQTVELMGDSGEDSNPPLSSRVLIGSVGEAWKIAMAVDDKITPEKLPGERKIYSSSGGVIKSFIEFLVTGISNWTATVKAVITAPTVEINGSTDYAVRFLALEASVVAFVAQLNSHTHVGVSSGIMTSGIPQTPMAFDVSAAKISNIKVGS